MSLQDLDFKDKKVLVRVDFNVPLDAEGHIVDDTRIREAIPTIQYILQKGGRVILLSHFGRPKGRDPKLSLKPCAQRLAQLLNKPVAFASDCLGEEAKQEVAKLTNGSLLLLENLRFYPAEEDPESDPTFAQKLAELGDLYINDAFGAAHRKHSSTYTIVKHFPGKAAPGLLIQKELTFLNALLAHPEHPFYALIGGSKVSSKIGMLQSLLSKVDGLFIAGAMAYTFFKAQGLEIGDSLYEKDFITTAKDFLNACSSKKIPLFLPLDNVITNQAAEIQIVANTIPPGWRGMDIGPATIKEWKHALSNAKTIFWNGPVGVFEIPAFATGTHEIAQTLAHLSCTKIVGGGDSIAAINALNLAHQFTHLSTGGGASLEYLEKGHLPGIDILFNF